MRVQGSPAHARDQRPVHAHTFLLISTRTRNVNRYHGRPCDVYVYVPTHAHAYAYGIQSHDVKRGEQSGSRAVCMPVTGYSTHASTLAKGSWHRATVVCSICTGLITDFIQDHIFLTDLRRAERSCIVLLPSHVEHS